MDARWDATMVANNWSDNGGRRPTREEFARVYSLASELWRRLGINFTELGEILCPFTDIDVYRSRVWQLVQKGIQRVL